MFPQRWSINPHNIDPVVEILTESTLSHHLLEISMCGKDQTRTQRDEPIAS